MRPISLQHSATNPALPAYQLTAAKNVNSIFIILGIALRLFHFFDNRSLWNDEMYLASSLVRLNLWELATSPLDYEQKAPLGFLWAVKLCVILFGKSEMALRLFPLLCGIATLFIFRPVAHYFLRPVAAVAAMGIMAFSPLIIYHAVEIKQYSTELLASVFLLALYCRYHQKTNNKSLFLYGILGAVTVWFSFSSVFMLVGIALGTCIYLALKKNWSLLFRSMIPFGIWAVSFGISYVLFVKNHPAKEWLVEWFALSHGFMPLPPKSAADMSWFVHKLFGIFHYPLGLSWVSLPPETAPVPRLLARMAIVPLALLVAGLVAFWRGGKKHLLVFSMPILLHLLASGVQAFPFLERLTFYLAPIFILLIARGVQVVTDFFPTKQWLAYLLVGLLLFGPVFNIFRQTMDTSMFADFKKSYDRETLLYIDQHAQPGDVVYVYWNNLVPYRYYKDNYGLKFKAVEGADHKFSATNVDEYMKLVEQDVQRLSGAKRVWLIYNKILPNGKIGDRMYDPEWYFKTDVHVPIEKVQPLFGKYGKQLEMVETRNVNVVLFDWNN